MTVMAMLYNYVKINEGQITTGTGFLNVPFSKFVITVVKLRVFVNRHFCLQEHEFVQDVI